MTKKIIAIIPARKGSKRLKNKNILRISGKPMIEHTIIHAKKSKIISKLVVSTDCQKVKKICLKHKLQVIDRPKKLSTSKASVNEVILDILDKFKKQNFEWDVVCCLYPTAPLRNTKDIDSTLKLILNKGADFSIAITKFVQLPYKAVQYRGKWLKVLFPKKIKLKSSELRDFYAGNGSIYCAKIKNFKKQKNFFGKKLLGHYMPTYKSIDLDYIEDLKHLKMLF